ncbi:Barrel-sandwich domain of CusB or HlyD membrane-fusion [uncultured archaeon]|nr:Barrel-sandwich domain of CusB or HlyD membrane-fusion [uncultured archaeon]
MNKPSNLSKLGKEMEKEETKLKDEINKEKKGLSWFFRSHTFKILITIAIFSILILGIVYLANSSGRIYIEKSEINAPVITLSPPSAGILQKVFVKEGDFIPSQTTVAMVSGNPVKSQISGLVILTQNTPGQLVSVQTPVVQMIDTSELRVIGHIQEDKGLVNIRPGQNVIFTVDAYGSKKFNGIVESVAPASDTSDIVFSISDNREEKQFNVKVKYDVSAYPELKQGMSVKMWVYK